MFPVLSRHSLSHGGDASFAQLPWLSSGGAVRVLGRNSGRNSQDTKKVKGDYVETWSVLART